jgi:hypothetical protein
MKAWLRVAFEQACGCCRRRLPRGEPVLELKVTGVKRAFYRCQQCAGEPVPRDLPPLVERVVDTTPLVPLRSVARLPIDWKAQGSGEA